MALQRGLVALLILLPDFTQEKSPTFDAHSLNVGHFNWKETVKNIIYWLNTGACNPPLKRHGPFVAFYLYCKIMSYGINHTYYSVKTVKIYFHLP